MSLASLMFGLIVVTIALFSDCTSIGRTRPPTRGINFMMGRCPAARYYDMTQNCSRIFYNTVREDREKATNCTGKYLILRRCMLDAFEWCLANSTLESFLISHQQRDIVVQHFLTFFGNENLWCAQGGLGIPQYVHAGTNCDPLYGHLTKDCVTTYQYIYNSRASLWRLCREYNKAKTCLLRSLVHHCSFATRALMQMIELMIEFEYNFQPFCSTPLTGGIFSFADLAEHHSCPPRAHSDVMFVIDTSGRTTSEEFASMKATIAEVTSKLDYGMSGIRIALVQYHERTQVSIRMNRYPTKKSFLRGLGRTARIATRSGHRRFTGQTLRYLANTLLNMEEPSSVIRPFHTPVCILLTTGASDDSYVDTAVQTLVGRNVHLVRIGPNYGNKKQLRDSTYHVEDTGNFSSRCGDILYEICHADSVYRTPSLNSQDFRQEGRTGGSSTLARLHGLFSRFGVTHLPLLWEPEELEIQQFDFTNNSQNRNYEIGIGTGYPNLSAMEFNFNDAFFEEGTGTDFWEGETSV